MFFLKQKKVLVYFALYIILFLIIASVIFRTPTETTQFAWLRMIIIIFASLLLTKYFIYMVLSPWNDVRQKMLQKEQKSVVNKRPYKPKVSVIVPAWNEEDGIITTVESLLKSSYKRMEIIVVDNASRDNTAKNVMDLIAKHICSESHVPVKDRISVKYLYEGAQGKGNALNTGLDYATGAIVVSIDADCFIPVETIRNFVNHFEDPSVMAAVGNVRIGNTHSLLGVVQYLEFLFSFYFKKAESLIDTIYIIGGAAGAFRRSIFKKIGQYSTTNITEDIELSVRIQTAGMRIAYASDAIVYTEGATTLDSLMKQRLRWKRGRFETFAEHRQLFFSTNKLHNKALSWFVLPVALFGELQLSLEFLFLAFLYIFSFTTGDFTPFISGIVVVSSMFVVQVLFDRHHEHTLAFLLLAPIGWMLFYVSTLVETSALFNALWGYARRKELVWQKWERQGVLLQPKEVM